MTYEAKAAQFDKEHIHVVEIDLEHCSLTHGSGNCTATETGDAKCFNTRSSCNDLANYDDNLATPSTKTYTFCSSRSPQPIGLDAIPSLKAVNIAEGKLDISGGLGIRSSVSLSFDDHPHSDIDIDPYLSDRTYDASERSTFWPKLRARNTNYQFRELRVNSGYLDSLGAYDAGNFKTRYYVIDKLDISKGMARVLGKDPLKLAMAKKAQVPVPNTGAVTGTVTAVATTFNVGTGEGAQYTTGYVVIGKEIMEVTNVTTDTLTVTRGQYNTTAAEHASGATVQQCYEQTGVNVDVIVEDLLTNFANVPSAYIDTAAWASESASYLEENLNGIIAKPTDVFKELKLLAKSAPHYLWWDEENQKIQFTALKAPPPSANTVDEDLTIENSLSLSDNTDMRYSTVLINFAPFDPTVNLDEVNNYQLSYVRIDSDSIAKYGSNQIEQINTRWIGTTGKGAAIKLATLIGRRFANVPREASWAVDPAYRLDLGGSINLNHRDMVDFTGENIDTMFQVISEKETDNQYKYQGLEFAYGQELTDDAAAGVTLVYISTDTYNVDLASLYETQVGTITGDIAITFVVDSGVKVGSTSTATYSLDMGDWSAATSVDITLEIKSGGYVVGMGGAGEAGSGTPGAGNGGKAMNLTEDITLVNNGTIGGGGGGGASRQPTGQIEIGGGGGAGYDPGPGGSHTNYSGGATIEELDQAEDGTVSAGGAGGLVDIDDGEFGYFGYPGGDLGAAGGGSGSGAAGKAVDLNGNTITYTVTGTISGVVS